MRRFRSFLKGGWGRASTALVMAATFSTCIEFGNYAYAVQVERNREAKIRAIAKKLNVDPEFLLHPGKSGGINLGGILRKIGLVSGARRPVSSGASAPLDITGAIQTVKSRYGLVEADTALTQIAQMLEVALAPSAFTGKHKGEIRSELLSVLHAVDKDFLPKLPPGLPGIAQSRDQKTRAAIDQIRTQAKSIINAPHALEDANLAATLSQLRAALSSLITVPAASPRWTKDPLPWKDVEMKAPVQNVSGGSYAGGLVRPSAAPVSPSAVPPKKAPSPATIPAPIQALAQSLGTPAKIFAYVHDHIDWESYSGIAKGSLGTLLEGRGNDWDQALLLSDLLTAAGFEAQLEWGKVELPIAQAMNLVGTQDPTQAASLFATAGFDAVALAANNSPIAVQFTHAWVRAYIPYEENRGATAGTPDTWVRMDPSLKRYTYSAGIPINGQVAWSEDDYLANSQLRAPEDYFSDKVWTYLRSNGIVCQNLSQVAQSGAIVAEDFPYVPATLTAKIDSSDGLSATPPSTEMQTVSLSVSDASGNPVATYSANLADLYGKKLTLTFVPATADDAAIIQSYGGLFNTPAYLINLAPVFAIDDQAVAQGSAVPAGAALDLYLTFAEPNVAPDTTHHSVIAGETHTEVFDPGQTPDAVIQQRITRLQQLISSGAPDDAVTSEELFLIGLRYMQEADAGLSLATGLTWQRGVKRAFEADVRRQIDVSYNVAGAPVRLIPADHNIDATRLAIGVIPITSDLTHKAQALSLAGMQSSYLEASIWEEMENQHGISAAKALLLSRMAGQTIYTADSSNVNTLLASVNLPADAEAEIAGAVAQGRIAKFASSPITLAKWSGTGYILEDPTTGAATYPISGGFAGGSDTGGGFGAGSDTLGNESWLDGSPLGALLQQLLALLGGGGSGSSSSGSPSTVQSDPVNLSNGNMFRSFTDFSITARGIPVALTRTYNSRSTYDGPFGYGWTFNYGAMVFPNSDGSITYREDDGTEHLFTKNADGSFNSPAGKYITLVSTNPGYTMTFKDGTVFTFDAAGYIVAQKDLNGNTVAINRDAGEDVTTVVDASGRTVLTFTYTSGKITTVTDLSGRTVQYAYTNDDLTSVTDTAGKVWTMGYDLAHNMTQFTDPLGNSDWYDYDSDDRLYHHMDANSAEEYFQYDIANGESVLTDRRGGDTYLQFDGTGRATLEADPAGNVAKATWDASDDRTQLVDPRGNTTSFAYDASGNLTQQTNPDGGVISTTYDAQSRPLTTTDALGVTTTNQYDGSENLLSSTKTVSGVTQTTTNTYDANGELLTTTDPNGNTTKTTWNGNGAMTSRTDALGNTTTMTPDALGHVTAITDPAGNATSVAYDAKDRMTSMTDPYGNTTSFTYDDAGRRTSVTTPRGTTSYTYDGVGRLLTTTDPLGNKTSTTYDAAGDVIARTDARGSTTKYLYDAIGRVTQMTDANGGVWSYGYCADLGGGGSSCATCGGGSGGSYCQVTAPDGNTITKTFDVMGRVSTVTDSLNHTMVYTYDKAGRKLSQTDANGNTTQYGYDEAGRLVAVTEPTGAVTTYGYDGNGNKVSQKDANGHIWSFKYDAGNRLVEEDDPLGRKTTYAYDALGNLGSKTDAKGQTIKYAYQIRRLTTVTYPDASTDSFTYDALGRRTGIANAAGSETFTYDALNRVTSQLWSRWNITIGYTYDANGNRTSMTTPEGTVNYAYDAKNRLAAIQDPVFGKFSFLYDGMDRRTELDYPGGAKTNYQYDPSYRLTAMVSKDPQGNVLDAWSYAYDAVGNRLSKTDMNGASETYQYDAGDRLTRAAYTDGTWEGFTYDPAGNRITRTGTGTQQIYAYDAANEMTSDGVSAYTYDANGNRTSMTTPNFAPNTYAYDFNNRLVTTGGPQGYEASQYDPDGRRVVVAGVGTGYGYGISTSTPMGVISDLQGNPILDWTTQSGGSIYAYRVYGPGVDEALAETHQGDNYRSYLLLHDGQGSVTAALYTGNNQVMYRNSYRAFGATTRYAVQSSVNPSRITYTGREMAPAQLLYYRARYMDTSNGNFLSQDTYRGDATAPPSLHRYVYALNNPVKYVDPRGMATDGTGSTAPVDQEAVESIEMLSGFLVGLALAIAIAIPFWEIMWPALVPWLYEFAGDVAILLATAATLFRSWIIADVDPSEIAAALARGRAVFYGMGSVLDMLVNGEAPSDLALAFVWLYSHCSDLSEAPGAPPALPDTRTIVCTVFLWLTKAFGI